MNITLSTAFIFLFCVDYYFMYSKTVKSNPEITQKQRAYIMSIKAATTLFLLSLYYNFRYIETGMADEVYISSFSEDDYFLIEIGTLHLISYFLMDCYIGYYNYHKELCGLSGYPHHIIYTVLGVIGIMNIRTLGPYYFLFLINELPTIILSSGHYNKYLRKDYTFGAFFFMIRVMYHGFLTWKFRKITPVLILGILSLSVHSYWFKNWMSKYFLTPKKEEKFKKTKNVLKNTCHVRKNTLYKKSKKRKGCKKKVGVPSKPPVHLDNI